MAPKHFLAWRPDNEASAEAMRALASNALVELGPLRAVLFLEPESGVPFLLWQHIGFGT